MGMIVLGIIFMIGGAISFIYGSSMNNSYEAQWNSFFNSGTKDPGSMFTLIGAFAVILGVIFVVIGIVIYNNKKGKYVKNNGYMNQFENKNNNRINQLIELKNKGLITEGEFNQKLQSLTNYVPAQTKNSFCTSCGAEIRESDLFCPRCGKKAE